MSFNPRIIVVVRGGVVQEILADGACEVLVMDYDEDDVGPSSRFDEAGRPFGVNYQAIDSRAALGLAVIVDKAFKTAKE
jgi:hypothetical protein